jgi:atypical dual specificity phosphatase
VLSSPLIFYPTLLWNIALSKLSPNRRWWDWVDDHVLLGALPMKHHVAKLKAEGISAVINTCREYPGPMQHYNDVGIEQLYLPTVDFTPPTLEHVQSGVAFIQRQIASGRKTYVHCKAGRGRSATIVMCYLISIGMKPDDAQKFLISKRPHVVSGLAKRQVVLEYASKIKTDAVI